MSFLTELNRKHRNGSYIYRYRNAFLILLNTGMRLGELLALTWDDIDLSNKTISISKDLVHTKVLDEKTGNKKYTILIQNSTKTEKGSRVIPMNKIAFDIFTEMKKAATGNIVVCSQNGNHVPQQTIDRSFARIISNCGLDGKNYSPHSLRHTFATNMFRQGVDVKTISELLGHSSIKVTCDTYIHIINELRMKGITLPESAVVA